MVVCKCRKATKLYCFVHKLPVCGECICFPEHQICVSGLTKNLLGNDLISGQLHEPRTPPPAFASDPLVSTLGTHVEGNSNSNVLSATTNETNISVDSASTAFNGSYTPVTRLGNSTVSSSDIVEMDGSVSVGFQPTLTHDSHFSKSPSTTGPGATTRKGSYRGDKYGPTFSPYEDDDDKSKRKYTRRGHFHNKFLRFLVPFWSPSPTLPVTAPRKEDRDGSVADELIEGHSRRRRSTVDPRKILLFIAIMSCMATMMLLYYRLSQSSAGEELPEGEQQ